MQVFATPSEYPVLIQIIPTSHQTDVQYAIATEFTALRLIEWAPEPDNMNRFLVKGPVTHSVLAKYGLLDQGCTG